LECSSASVRDRAGAGLIVSGKHYDSRPMEPYRGFLYRKNLDGAELWRHSTNSSASSIKTTRDSRFVIAAFLDGSLAVLRSETGEVIRWETCEASGLATIIFSLDVSDSKMLFGTIDGRFGTVPLASLIG
jgi:hypothetical protein